MAAMRCSVNQPNISEGLYLQALIASNKVGVCRRSMRPIKTVSISNYAVEGEYSVESAESVESVEQRRTTQ
jgi:hypothetical protein